MEANRVSDNEHNTKRKISAKHILLSLLGALIITALGVLSAPLNLIGLSAVGWILLIFSPFSILFLFFMLLRRPAHSVFWFIKGIYCLAAPALPVLWLPVFFAYDRSAYYTENFFNRFLPVWAAIWWLGLIIVYIFLKLLEYAAAKILAGNNSRTGLVRDLAVMYTPQKTISTEKREGRKWGGIVLIALLVIPAIFLFVVSLFLFNVYSNMEFESILFTVRFAKGGLAVEDVIAGTKYTLLFVLIAGFILYNVFKCFRNDKVVVEDTNEEGKYTLVMTRGKRALHIVLSVLLFIGCIGFFALQTNFVHYLSMKSNQSSIYETYYVKPDESVVTFPEKKRNLIFIYLESFETSYASTEVGGNLDKNYIAPLTELAKEKDAVHFSNTGKVGGASVFVPSITFTQGSTVAQTSGISLNTKILPQNGKVEYPTMIRLEDILHDNGYNQIYIEGSKGEFSMYDEYVGRYDDCKLYDRINLAELGYTSEDEDYIWKWGIEDRKLFDITKQLITDASKEDKPFFVTMYTMDTHSFECGHRCSLCDESIENDYLAAVNCTARQAAEFVEWAKQQPFYENTTIILVGDHLGNEKTTMVEFDEDYTRTTFNLFINAPKTPVNTQNRQFSSLDMFPSTLSAIGVEIKGDRLGLGTDLFSATPTLCEELGEEEYTKQLEQDSDFYDNVLTPEQKSE